MMSDIIAGIFGFLLKLTIVGIPLVLVIGMLIELFK